MQRSAFMVLLMVAVLAGQGHAQRMGGGMAHFGGVGLGRPAGTGGLRGGFGDGFGFRHGPRSFRVHRVRPFGTVELGGLYEPFWYDETYSNVSAPAPQVIVIGDAAPAPAPAPAPPPKVEMIEVPDSSGHRTKPQPPVIFVLSNGERLQARRFTLTTDFLDVSTATQPRRIPLSAVNLEATLAANHERGIELKIPTEPSEISLGF
jgi:hypothetical protein